MKTTARRGFAAAIATLLLVLSACSASSNRSSAGPSGVNPSSPASPSASTQPTGLTWSELPATPVPGLADLVAYAGGYLGVGTSTKRDGSTLPAVWVSADRTAWTAYPVTVTPAGALWEGLSFTQVVVTGKDRLVAFVSGPGVFAASSPSGPWQHVDLGEMACAASLAAKGTTVVAVGSIGACAMGGATRPAAWISRDGESWQPAELASSSTGTGGGWFAGVANMPGGGLIGWGWFLHEPICDVGCEIDVETDPFAGAPWISSDGAVWRQIKEPMPFRGGYIEQIQVVGDVYLALGWRGQGSRTVRAMWSSSDGRSWEQLAEDPPFLETSPAAPFGGNERIGGGDAGMVAWIQKATTTSTWFSFDGVTWEAAGTLQGSVGAVKLIGQRFFALGTREEADPGITLPCRKDQVVEGKCRTVPVVWIWEPTAD